LQEVVRSVLRARWRGPSSSPLFPGKSLRCATEEFAAFLIQFLGGDEKQTQYRWWLSLRESHARFQIGSNARRAWLRYMEATLDAAPLDDATRNALRHFFSRSSAYVIGRDTAESDHEELAARWSEQRVLDSVIAAIVESRDDETLALAPRFASRPSVFVGLLARMVQSGRARLIQFVIDAVESDPSLATRRFAGTTLLHFAAGAGCLEVVALLLRLGVDPNIQGRGDHRPLSCVANQCVSKTGPEVVRALQTYGPHPSIQTLFRNDGGADILKNPIFRVRPRHKMAHRAHHFIIYKMPLVGCRISFSNVTQNKPGVSNTGSCAISNQTLL